MMRTSPTEDKSGEPDVSHCQRQLSVREFRKIVLDHYRDNGRDLEWRRTTDPYRILVSEIMLQQTQVERVAVKFPAFIAAFPDFAALAGAPLPGILAEWQGMGYNRRAIMLRKCAQKVVDEFGGVLPQDPEILSTFPGIGKATAGSISVFAFNKPAVFIETNIRRVFIHYFFGDNTGPVHDADILPIIQRTLDRKNPRIWYWALMDLGSDIKKRFPNPNRRSAHYARQSVFEGSDRELRGKILRLLLEKQNMDIAGIALNTGVATRRIEKILAGLEDEGFLTRSGNGFEICSR